MSDHMVLVGGSVSSSLIGAMAELGLWAVLILVLLGFLMGVWWRSRKA